jgi:hypothetical protein
MQLGEDLGSVDIQLSQGHANYFRLLRTFLFCH